MIQGGMGHADIRPFPKAEPRKLVGNKRGRKGRTKILTDTPEKQEIENQTNERKQKKILKAKPQKKRKLFQIEESTDEETSISIHDTSDDDIDLNVPEDIEEIDWEKENIGLNDFVLVKFSTKKSVVHYVGRVEDEDCMDSFNVLFLRKNEKGNFIFPQESDCSIVDKADIIAKLSPPRMVGGTSRAQAYFSFDLDFSKYNVR